MMQSQDMGTMVAGGRDLANGAVGLKPQPFTLVEILYLHVTVKESLFLVRIFFLSSIGGTARLLLRPTFELQPNLTQQQQPACGEGKRNDNVREDWVISEMLDLKHMA